MRSCRSAISTNTAPKESEKTSVAARMPNAAGRPRPGSAGATLTAAPHSDLVLGPFTAADATAGPPPDQSTFVDVGVDIDIDIDIDIDPDTGPVARSGTAS